MSGCSIANEVVSGPFLTLRARRSSIVSDLVQLHFVKSESTRSPLIFSSASCRFKGLCVKSRLGSAETFAFSYPPLQRSKRHQKHPLSGFSRKCCVPSAQTE
jgi:hypothetical protein